MRIISGKFKGKQLLAPEGMNTRPTADRVKESIFNLIASHLNKNDKTFMNITVLDAFAGTGALGIEAISRGARVVYFAENDKNTRSVLKKNIENLKIPQNYTAHFADAFNLSDAPFSFDLIFLDPPYGQGIVPKIISQLLFNGWISQNSLCVIESEKSEKNIVPFPLSVLDERLYGKTKVTLATLQ